MRLRARRKSGKGIPRLEVKSKVDGGWYDGKISLVDGDSIKAEKNPGDLQVRVHFTDFVEDMDEFWGPEILHSENEIRSRVRLISRQLQDDACYKVVPGMVVCANFVSADGADCKYYDALVHEVNRVEHETENRNEVCHCRFVIMWREGPLIGRFGTLKCPHISILATRDVRVHPLVSELLDFASGHFGAFRTVSGFAVSEESTVRLKVLRLNASNLKLEDSEDEMLESTEAQEQPEISQIEWVQEQEGFNSEILQIEWVREQEVVTQEYPEEEEHGKLDGGEQIVEMKEEREEEAYEEEMPDVDELLEGNFTQEDLDTWGLNHEKEYPEAGLNREQDLGEKRVSPEGSQERKWLSEENPKVSGSSDGSIREDFETEEVQARRATRGKPEIEKLQEQGMCRVEEKAKCSTKDESEEEMPEIRATELNWDDEILGVTLMERSNLGYRYCEDEFLDLPKDIETHLRNFQLIQDCLTAAALELEKALEASLGKADNPKL